MSHECNTADSDASIAYAKLRAVYPSKTKAALAQGSPDTFANEPAVKSVLGSVKYLQERSAEDLYEKLQHYVDSKEKSDSRKKKKPMELWPLVKVVRIFTKASALSTGAVIVDLVIVPPSTAAGQQTYSCPAWCSRLERRSGSCGRKLHEIMQQPLDRCPNNAGCR